MTEAPLPQSHRTLLADFARALDMTAGGYQLQARAIRAYLLAVASEEADGGSVLDHLPAIVTVVNSSVVTGERRYEVKG